MRDRFSVWDDGLGRRVYVHYRWMPLGFGGEGHSAVRHILEFSAYGTCKRGSKNTYPYISSSAYETEIDQLAFERAWKRAA